VNQTPTAWLTYVDAQLGFSIQYPDTYALLPETQPLKDIAPGLIQRVRFLNDQLAKSDTADFQPPDFSIEVFENPSGTSLNAWVQANAAKGSSEETRLDDAACVKLTLATLLAPNEFYYCAWNNAVYKLIPLGTYGPDMLKSFKFGR
jgi:hypothetical protein